MHLALLQVFELKSPTPKNDFCRLFAKCGALDRLVSALSSTNDEAQRVKTSVGLSPRERASVHARNLSGDSAGPFHRLDGFELSRSGLGRLEGADLRGGGFPSPNGSTASRAPLLGAGHSTTSSASSMPGGGHHRSTSSFGKGGRGSGGSAQVEKAFGAAPNPAEAWAAAETARGYVAKLANLLLVFSHADSLVKGFMCSLQLLHRLFKMMERLEQPILVKVRATMIRHVDGGMSDTVMRWMQKIRRYWRWDCYAHASSRKPNRVFKERRTVSTGSCLPFVEAWLMRAAFECFEQEFGSVFSVRRYFSVTRLTTALLFPDAPVHQEPVGGCEHAGAPAARGRHPLSSSHPCAERRALPGGHAQPGTILDVLLLLDLRFPAVVSKGRNRKPTPGTFSKRMRQLKPAAIKERAPLLLFANPLFWAWSHLVQFLPIVEANQPCC